MEKKQTRMRKKSARSEIAPTPAGKEPTRREAEAWARARAKSKTMPVRPNMTVEQKNGTAMLSFPEHEESGYLIYEALGSGSAGFIDTKLLQLVNLCRTGGEATSADLNEAVAFVASVEPANELEATLAVQIYGAQKLAYEMLNRTRRAEYLPQMQAYGNLANKFARTAGTLTETLMKLRRGGEQVVRHIHVNEGGQAIVAEQFNHYAGG